MLAVVAAGVLFVALIVAGIMVFRITTDKGTVVIESDDPNVEVVVKQGGKQVRIVDVITKQEIELNTGQYEFQLVKGPDGLSLSTDRLTLKRGKTEIVRVRREVPVPTKPDTGVVATKPPGPVNKNPDEDEKQKDAKRLADAEAARLQEEAKRRAEAAEAQRQQEQKRRDDFNKCMTQGQEHANAKRYSEAIQAYDSALKLIPGDTAATKARSEANQAWTAQLAETNRKPPDGVVAETKPSAPDQKPEPLIEVDKKMQEDIKEAVRKGVEYLMQIQGPEGMWPPHRGGTPGGNFPLGYTALPALTLLECGVPKNDASVQKAAKFVRNEAKESYATYQISLTILFLDRLGDPQDVDSDSNPGLAFDRRPAFQRRLVLRIRPSSL